MTDEEGLPTAAPERVEGHEVHEPEEDAAGSLGAGAGLADGSPDAHGAGGDGADGAAGGRRPRGLVVLCVVLGLAALGFGIIAAIATQRLEDVQGDRDEAERVAGRFAEALLTYDYERLEEAKQRVLALSTGNFRAEYEKAFDGGLEVLFRETQARSAGTVTDVFVGPIEDDAVTVIAVVDAVARGTAGGRRLMSSYVQLSLVKVGGKWKVDGVTNLNLAAPTSESQTPLPTTTTTAPK